MAKEKRIVLGVTASVAIYKACDLIRRLKEKNTQVTVVMTPEAAQFIKPLLFQTLTANPVYVEMFDSAHGWDIEHVSLAQQADCIVIAPATAHFISSVANGLCDSLLTSIVCATKKPVLICPAMNEGMYTNKIIQENIKKLRSLEYHFVDPKVGMLACGATGKGCLADIDEILKAIMRLL